MGRGRDAKKMNSEEARREAGRSQGWSLLWAQKVRKVKTSELRHITPNAVIKKLNQVSAKNSQWRKDQHFKWRWDQNSRLFSPQAPKWLTGHGQLYFEVIYFQVWYFVHVKKGAISSVNVAEKSAKVRAEMSPWGSRTSRGLSSFNKSQWCYLIDSANVTTASKAAKSLSHLEDWIQICILIFLLW